MRGDWVNITQFQKNLPTEHLTQPIATSQEIHIGWALDLFASDPVSDSN